jgi:hypothetical protein
VIAFIEVLGQLGARVWVVFERMDEVRMRPSFTGWVCPLWLDALQ